jgi:hypothetical protein
MMITKISAIRHVVVLLIITGNVVVQAVPQQGPNADDTLEWVRSHSSWLSCSPQITFGSNSMTVYRGWSKNNTTGACTIDRGSDIVGYSLIVSVTVIDGTERDDHGIVLAHYPAILLRYDGIDTKETWFGLNSTVSMDDANRYAHAISHLAELNGAKLVRDGLF